ncbi:AAA family ATPase [Rhizobacter sp. Root404]|uniref:AAA family ATPase n=1 Tax=Rhizobacter sp. Root404 TaxID=1736528 RepID=UPI00138EE880|nr:AAA family ATPase [Rhizobacter sp. Root404]
MNAPDIYSHLKALAADEAEELVAIIDAGKSPDRRKDELQEEFRQKHQASLSDKEYLALFGTYLDWSIIAIQNRLYSKNEPYGSPRLPRSIPDDAHIDRRPLLTDEQWSEHLRDFEPIVLAWAKVTADLMRRGTDAAATIQDHDLSAVRYLDAKGAITSTDKLDGMQTYRKIYMGELRSLLGLPPDEGINNQQFGPRSTGARKREAPRAHAPSSVVEAPQDKTSNDRLESLLAALDDLVGMHPVKEEVRKLVDLIRVNKLRESRGIPANTLSHHLVFFGNPGTGKTTVARLVGMLFKELGLLSKGHLVETDRSGMVAGYVGQTALKTKQLCDSAAGGILFIDEAYSLSQNQNDFGQEALETLLKIMEDRRDDMIVIVAGYPDDMNGFLRSNPGLESRFAKRIHFPDYSGEELHRIYEGYLRRASMKETNDALLKSSRLLTEAAASAGKGFGNGRFARNLFERTMERHASRISRSGQFDDSSLLTVEAPDIQEPG